MKALVFLFFFLIFSLSPGAEGQVRVLSENIEFNGKIGTSQRKSIIIQNETNQAKEYVLKFLRGNVGSSQNIKLCLGDNCYDPRKDLAKIRFTLQPGEISTDMYLEFDMGISETKGNFDLHFTNTSNLREVFLIESVYNVFSTNSEGAETIHNDISISSVYPNPSSRIAQIDYEFKNPAIKAKISINSFIGNPIAEFQLDPNQKYLVINVSEFNPGVYFYTLFVDNKNIVSKKLVVKK
jgi:hypothetical protein